jgi:hypothetical protein
MNNAEWTGYVVYDAGARYVLATFARSELKQAYAKRDLIASLFPKKTCVLVELVTCSKRPSIGNEIRIAAGCI